MSSPLISRITPEFAVVINGKLADDLRRSDLETLTRAATIFSSKAFYAVLFWNRSKDDKYFDALRAAEQLFMQIGKEHECKFP